MRFPPLYFDWLQKDAPVGTIGRFPELTGRFETSVPGLYCIGDLTGIPLIKLAAESGHEFMDRLSPTTTLRRSAGPTRIPIASISSSSGRDPPASRPRLPPRAGDTGIGCSNPPARSTPSLIFPRENPSMSRPRALP